MKILAEGGSLAALKENTPLLLVQFGSASCGPCTAIRQRIDRWMAAHPGSDGVYVPIEDFPAVAAEEGVFTVPTVLVFAEGRITLRESGYFSLDALLDRAGRYLELMR